MFTTALKLAYLFFLLYYPVNTVSRPHPTLWSESRWVCTICLTHESITHIPHHAMKVVEWTLRFTLMSITLMSTEFLIKQCSYWCLWQPFCTWLYPASVRLPGLDKESSWRVANSLQKLSLMVTTPWQDRLSSATQCSDKKENTLLGSSPSSAKRQSLD